MTTLERTEQIVKFWTFAMPEAPKPTNEQLILWAQRYTDAEIEWAIGRAASKFRRGQIEPTPDAFGRYVSGVLMNERARQTADTEHAANRVAIAKEMESREELL